MATLYTHKDRNIRKTWLLMAFFLAGVVLLGWFVSLYFGNPAILYSAAITAQVWSRWKTPNCKPSHASWNC